MAKLTVKQQKFVEQYILCGNASEAYRSAYSASKMKPDVINVKASELLNNGKVAVRVKELQKESQKEFCVTAEQKRRMLWKLVEHCAETDEESQKIKNPNAVISAIAEMNKMDGHLATIKNEVSGDLTVTNLIADLSKRNAEQRAILPKQSKK